MMPSHIPTPAETEVLILVARGMENAEIAAERGCSVETVRTQMKSILRRLSARNRAHAVAIAYHIGFFKGAASPTTEEKVA